jgi:phosphatidate cytidylyltransferase
MMMLIFASAITVGGYPFKIFVALLVVGLLREWFRLAAGFAQTRFELALWSIVGFAYIVFAAWTLVDIRDDELALAVYPIAIVIATDVGAYFSGRTFGGPKIAPRISPSKTWSGLVGGMIAAAIVSAVFTEWLVLDDSYQIALMGIFVAAGAVLAVFAQSGDFLESWMKRRAGVKDSGRLIPGHGGLLDRMDGLLAVLCIFGVVLSFNGGFQ